MATNKGRTGKGAQQADQKNTHKRGQAGINEFRRGAVIEAFEAMAAAAEAVEAGATSRSNASLALVTEADRYRKAALKITDDLETIVSDWRENFKQCVTELAAKGSPFATMIEGKGDNPDYGKLSGYGNNVASIAKGVIEHSIDVSECTAGEGGEVTYDAVRVTVQNARANAVDPATAQMREAKQSCQAAWAKLRSAVYKRSDLDVIEALTETLDKLREDMQQVEADESEESEELEQAEAA